MPSPPDRPAAAPSLAREAEVRAWMADYGPALKRYFTRKVSAAEADDLVQDVFLAMHTRTAATRIDNVQGYLFRVAVSVLARRSREGDAFDAFVEGLEPVDEFSPERLLGGKQDVERLMAAIRTLPPRSRAAFVLHRFEEMTYAAIGREMGIGSDAVKALLSRAIVKLIAALGDER